MSATPGASPTGPSAAPPLGLPLPGPAADPVRVIRRSLRCFTCGFLGVVPGLGLALALEAINLHRFVARETGETGNPERFHLCFGAGWVILALAGYEFGSFTIFGLLPAFLGWSAWRLWRRYRHATGVVWNPARAHLYAGVAFAYAGFSSLGLLLLMLIRVASRLP